MTRTIVLVAAILLGAQAGGTAFARTHHPVIHRVGHGMHRLGEGLHHLGRDMSHAVHGHGHGHSHHNR